MFLRTDMFHAMGVTFVSFVVVFIGFTFRAEGASSIPVTQVVGYLTESAVLRCPHTVSREDLSDVMWFKKNDEGAFITVAKLLLKSRPFKQLIQDEHLKRRFQMTFNSVRITSVNLGDGGLYRCTMSVLGRPSERYWKSNLDVYVRPQSVVVSPRFDGGVKEGTRVDFNCSVQQVKPRPKIFWRIGEVGPVHNGSHMDSVTEHPNGTFSINSMYQWQVKYQDDGKSVYCIIVQADNHTEVLGQKDTRISVLCSGDSTSAVVGSVLGILLCVAAVVITWLVVKVRRLTAATDGAPRTPPLTTIADVQQPAVVTSAPAQPATRDGTYQGLYQIIPEVRQSGGEYEMIQPSEAAQGDRNEMPYAHTGQYENTRLA